MAPGVTIKLPYRPNPKQKEFHGMQAKYRGFVGGWGNGKTTGGCAEFFIRLMEFPGTNSIIARKTRPELRTTTWDMLVNGDTQDNGWRGIPKEVIEVYNKSDLYIKLRNGSQIHGLSLDDPKKLENYNIGLYMVDQGEEVEEEYFIKFQGRLRQHGTPREGIWLFNPDGHNWLWRRFIDRNRKQLWKQLHRVVEATPFDNPNLPADFLEQFESLPKHWYDRYVLGSHEVFVGQIFVDFNPDLHVIEPFHIPAEWERWCCIDPGIGHEGAVNWLARDWANNVYLYRELVEKGQPADWWAEQVFNIEASRDVGGPDEEMFVRLIGPEANQRAQTDGRTVKQVYEEEGFDDLDIADRDPLARIHRITQRLRPKVGHDHPLSLPPTVVTDQMGDELGLGSPSLYIFSTCGYTVEHLPQYKWRPTRVSFSDEDPPEKVRKKNDHTIDNIGHVLVSMGDSEPDVPDNSRPLTGAQLEARELDEHFAAELEAAGANEEFIPIAALLNGGR